MRSLTQVSGVLLGSCIAFALAALITAISGDLGAFVAYLIGAAVMGVTAVRIEILIAPLIPPPRRLPPAHAPREFPRRARRS